MINWIARRFIGLKPYVFINLIPWFCIHLDHHFVFRAKNQLEYILCKCFYVDCRYEFTFCVEISASVLPHSAIICSINQICIFGEHPQFTEFSHTSSNICWWAILAITTYTSSTMISLFWPFQNFLCHLLQMFGLARAETKMVSTYMKI